MAKSWYVFLGSGDPLLSSNYLKVTVQHTCLCGNQICAIYSEGDEEHPESPLSPQLQEYIRKALATGQIQPDYPVNAKKYVYLRYR
ncbi:hypothetical protein [Pedobacter gandavensis]|uniref:hypothetical protein n=1 Tax=Pedobacter gandavensis TaxID=2679963 RepID=UPI00292CA6F2|nr:hypothetical protein [Pedobacter gandavensis]